MKLPFGSAELVRRHSYNGRLTVRLDISLAEIVGCENLEDFVNEKIVGYATALTDIRVKAVGTKANNVIVLEVVANCSDILEELE